MQACNMTQDSYDKGIKLTDPAEQAQRGLADTLGAPVPFSGFHSESCLAHVHAVIVDGSRMLCVMRVTFTSIRARHGW